jgi:hypothetical protein
LNASELACIESICTDSLHAHVHQTEMESIPASTAISDLTAKSLLHSVCPLDVLDVLAPLRGSDLLSSSECVVDNPNKSVPINEGVPKNIYKPAEVSVSMLSDDHPSRINFFDGSDDLFDLADEDVNHLDVGNSDGDDEAVIDVEDNLGFCQFGNASVEDLGVVNSGGIQHSAKVE